MTPSDSIFDDDQIQSFQSSLASKTVFRWLATLAGLYAIFLAATIPAAVVFRPPPGMTVSGSIWDGEIFLSRGHRGSWTISPARSIGTLSVAIDWILVGPGTNLTGKARLRPGNLTLDDVAGRADTALVKALFPTLIFECDGEARVDLRHFRWTRSAFEIDGNLSSAPASCPGLQNSPTVQPLVLTLSGRAGDIAATLVSQTAPAVTLASAELGPSGHFRAEVSPDAATVIPGFPHTDSRSGPFELETTLTLP